MGQLSWKLKYWGQRLFPYFMTAVISIWGYSTYRDGYFRPGLFNGIKAMVYRVPVVGPVLVRRPGRYGSYRRGKAYRRKGYRRGRGRRRRR